MYITHTHTNSHTQTDRLSSSNSSSSAENNSDTIQKTTIYYIKDETTKTLISEDVGGVVLDLSAVLCDT